MKFDLLEFLVCPTCRGKLKEKIKKQTKNEIIDGVLVCQECNEKFKISNGIPRFVVDETSNFIKTEDAFSAKWRTYHKSYHEKNGLIFKEIGISNDFNGKL